MADVNSNIPKNLLHYRKAAGFTQIQISERVGTNQNNYSRWETGACLPSVDMLAKLAFMFNVTVDDLIAERKEGA